MRRAFVFAVVLAHAGVASAADPVDWNDVADVGTIQILTTNEDGSTRETTIWLVVQEGHGYIRTSGTRWLANIERNPDVVVRVEGTEYPLRAVKVTDSETYEAVTRAFREKYGWSDRLTGLFRVISGVPTILRLDPRTSLAPAN
jgi:hypothetical protein